MALELIPVGHTEYRRPERPYTIYFDRRHPVCKEGLNPGQEFTFDTNVLEFQYQSLVGNFVKSLTEI